MSRSRGQLPVQREAFMIFAIWPMLFARAFFLQLIKKYSPGYHAGTRPSSALGLLKPYATTKYDPGLWLVVVAGAR